MYVCTYVCMYICAYACAYKCCMHGRNVRFLLLSATAQTKAQKNNKNRQKESSKKRFTL